MAFGWFFMYQDIQQQALFKENHIHKYLLLSSASSYLWYNCGILKSRTPNKVKKIILNCIWMYNKHIFFYISLAQVWPPIYQVKEVCPPRLPWLELKKVDACYRTRSEPSRKFQPPRNVDPGLEQAMVIKTFKFGFL